MTARSWGQMESIIGPILVLALMDMVNPSAIAVTISLLLTSTVAHVWVLSYAPGMFSTYLVTGRVLMLGYVQPVLESLVAYASGGGDRDRPLRLLMDHAAYRAGGGARSRGADRTPWHRHDGRDSHRGTVSRGDRADDAGWAAGRTVATDSLLYTGSSSCHRSV